MAVHQVSFEIVFATNADFFRMGPLQDEIAENIKSFCGKYSETGVIAIDGWVHLDWKLHFMACRRVSGRQVRILTF